MRRGLQLTKLMHGASHESNRRPGTENVLEIVGLGKAAQMRHERFRSGICSHYQEMRDRLYLGLLESSGEKNMRINGHPKLRLPNTLSVSFKNVEANTLLAEISDQVAASAGAACHADQMDVSQVLKAMKVPLEWAMGTVRLTVGRETTKEQIDTAVKVISGAVKETAVQSVKKIHRNRILCDQVLIV